MVNSKHFCIWLTFALMTKNPLIPLLDVNTRKLKRMSRLNEDDPNIKNNYS